jgi:hypothetical protein
VSKAPAEGVTSSSAIHTPLPLSCQHATHRARNASSVQESWRNSSRLFAKPRTFITFKETNRTKGGGRPMQFAISIPQFFADGPFDLAVSAPI